MEAVFLLSLSSLSRFLCRNGGMDGDERATSERILLEPYKYLLQLPGECICWALRFYFWLHVQWHRRNKSHKILINLLIMKPRLSSEGKTDKIFTLEQKQTEFFGLLCDSLTVSYFEYVKLRISWKARPWTSEDLKNSGWTFVMVYGDWWLI